MKRVEDVLGKGWENHVEGQKLKADADSFRLKLNTQSIFDDWSKMVRCRSNENFYVSFCNSVVMLDIFIIIIPSVVRLVSVNLECLEEYLQLIILDLGLEKEIY